MPPRENPCYHLGLLFLLITVFEQQPVSITAEGSVRDRVYHDPKKISRRTGSPPRPHLIENLPCEWGPMSCGQTLMKVEISHVAPKTESNPEYFEDELG